MTDTDRRRIVEHYIGIPIPHWRIIIEVDPGREPFGMIYVAHLDPEGKEAVVQTQIPIDDLRALQPALDWANGKDVQ